MQYSDLGTVQCCDEDIIRSEDVKRAEVESYKLDRQSSGMIEVSNIPSVAFGSIKDTFVKLVVNNDNVSERISLFGPLPPGPLPCHLFR